VQAFGHAGEVGDATWSADGGGGVGVAKAHGLGHEGIEMRGLDDGMPHRAEGVVTLVVGEDENDVGRRVFRLGGMKPR